jgi:formate dehydrogenase maturation protein FdhE
MFIITGICMTFIVGLFMSLCIVNTTEMRDGWKKNLVTIVLALAIGFGISGLMTLEHQANVETWNDGYCEECGGEWHLVDVVKSRTNGGTRYYWECEDCYNLIDTTTKFK